MKRSNNFLSARGVILEAARKMLNIFNSKPRTFGDFLNCSDFLNCAELLGGLSADEITVLFCSLYRRAYVSVEDGYTNTSFSLQEILIGLEDADIKMSLRRSGIKW